MVEPKVAKSVAPHLFNRQTRKESSSKNHLILLSADPWALVQPAFSSRKRRHTREPSQKSDQEILFWPGNTIE